jgi:hypothetical protein
MMVSLLRHTAFRLWAAVVLGGLASLAVLPLLQAYLGLETNVLVTGVILLVFFLTVGWASNRWALHKTDRLTAQAGAFERDGMYPEAEDAFRRAVALFDSFMVSPAVRRKRAAGLGARISRFYLARSRLDQTSEDFLADYLNFNPRDGEVARHWLHRVEGRGGLKDEHQELAWRIGEAQPKDLYIQRILARFYLLLERTDFSALQTYRRVCEAEDPPPREFITELAKLFLKAKRADEWALAIYLQALAYDDDQTEYLRGLAACVHWIPDTGRTHRQLQHARQYLQTIDANALKTMAAGFNPPLPSEPVRKARKRIRPGALLVAATWNMASLTGSALHRVFDRIKKTAGLMRHSRTARRVFTAILLSGLALGIGGLVVNTVSHLKVSEAPPAQKAPEPALPIVTDPFTLQVAAYLKAEYAKSYVQELKKRGLDAYWSEAVRGDKRWFQVRVSHFATKQSARDYGDKLKSEGIIDDYYVANFSRP